MSSSYHSYPKGTFQEFLKTGKYKAAGSAQTTPEHLACTVLGDDVLMNGTKITLGDIERRSGLYVLGKTGMGKSALLVNLALQDSANGHGIFFLDPHVDAVNDILSRLPTSRKNDVVLLDPTDETHCFGINLVACPNLASRKERRRTFSRAYAVFYALWQYEWGPWIELIVSYLLQAFIENPGYTLAQAPQFLLDASFRKKLVSNIQYNPRVAEFWQHHFTTQRPQEQNHQVQAALTRLDQLLSDPDVAHVIGQRETTFDFTQIMNQRKIVLAPFSVDLAENVRRFLGTILVRELLQAAKMRKADRSQFCVFVDEFQNFATPDFAIIIRETRKFGIAPTLAQQITQGKEFQYIHEAIGAMANKVVFQPTVENAEQNAKEFAKRPDPARVEILKEESVELIAEESIEVLQEEYEVPKIDEWEDGVEPILALADKPFDQLTRGHSNAQVSQLSGTLRELAYAIEKAQAETEQADIWTQKVSSERVFRHKPDGESGIEYVATREQLLDGKQLIETLIADVQHGTIEYGSYRMVDRLTEIAERLRAFIGFSQGAVWEKESDTVDLSYISYSRYGKQIVPSSRAASRGGWGDVSLDPETERYLPNVTKVVVSEAPAIYQNDGDSSLPAVDMNGAKQDFAQVRLYSLVQTNVEEQDIWCDCGDKYKSIHIAAPQTPEDVLNLPAELPREKQREILAERRVMLRNFRMIAAAESRRLVDFLSKLAGLCLAQSSPEQHIRIPSGQYRPGKHKQIHYEPHPRLTLSRPRQELHHQRLDIPHPQRSIADMVAEKELDLLDLPVYTAAYKLLPSGGGAVLKGTLGTLPLPPPQQLLTVQQLRKHIVSATHRDYCLERDKIEAEMKQRLEDELDLSSGTQPSTPSQEQGKKDKKQRSGQE